MDRKRLIGKENRLPWHLPADLAYFKKTTLHHAIVMGRKTYESIGKPLPGRENIVLTRDPHYTAEGCRVMHTRDEVLREAEERTLFVIGGAELYKLFLSDVMRMHITHIDHEFEGDTFFPVMDESEWHLVSDKKGVRDERNPYHYSVRVYERRRKNDK